jgi:hypothetical protein
MVPIRYVSPYLTLDSVSFVGSIKPQSFTGIGFDFEDIQLVKISYIYVAGSVPPPSIQDTSGVIAELFFTLSAEATPQFIPIDSASIDSFIIVGEDTVTNFWTGVVLSNATGDSTYFPDCIAGGVEVLSPTDVNEDGDIANLPASLVLSQNYPNPFNPSTLIEYAVPKAGKIKLEVFNIIGQSVAVLFEGATSPGVHRVKFEASNYPSGIYFYRLEHSSGTLTKKMVLIK